MNEQHALIGAPGTDRWADGNAASAISNAVVSLFVEYLGRGPTRARTAFGRDVVTVVLEETLTKAERRLVAEGESESVIGTRRIFQRTMREDMIEAVERLVQLFEVTDRKDEAAKWRKVLEAIKTLQKKPEKKAGAK